MVLTYDIENRRYLDFIAGITINTLGHCNPEITGTLSKLLIKKTTALGAMHIAFKAFICNSSFKVNKAVIKFAYKVGKTINPSSVKYEFISFYNSFYSRTIGSLSATLNLKYRIYNNIKGVNNLITENTYSFLIALRNRYNKVSAVLIYNKIYVLPKEVYPNILTIAKALRNSFPIGATIVNKAVAIKIVTGDYGTIFGGNPLDLELQKLQRFLDIIIELNQDPMPIVTTAYKKGLLIITCGINTL
ncbi:PLP-dependent transferase [Cenococcum geophilum 1.58]|uniref:PLP-dependent transferase n=1 Tax=Cenococcum geophilum 1.58 TaxID=794803 RepID=UPI0035900958|nr:PLP-dependent transferase [Cenococcum geophilum 1.58]